MDNPYNLDDLYAAFQAADSIVLKKYISSLSDAPCIALPKEIKAKKLGSNVALYRIAKIVYDQNENVQEKLTTVYSTVFSLKNCGVVMLIDAHPAYINLYLGVVHKPAPEAIADSSDILLMQSGKVLVDAFQGNFPGTVIVPVNNEQTNLSVSNPVDNLSKEQVLKTCFKDVRHIAAVSSIPAVRAGEEHKNPEFIQGLEKLIDSMRGKEYTALILADALGTERIEQLCAAYEDIYSQLVPFKSSVQTLSRQEGSTETESIIEGVTDTTNRSVSRAVSHSDAVSKTHTDTGSAGVNIKMFKADYSHAYARGNTHTDGTTDTIGEGTAQSLTKQNSVAKAISETDGESIQLSFENRAVKTLLERIDGQIKRMRACEDYGVFETCAYFCASDYAVAVAAASTFKSVTRGDNSSVEAAAVNVWSEQEDVRFIKDYLQHLYHPVFLTVLDEEHSYPTAPTVLISGKEMAYQMPLPKKSVSGLPILECAEFGREIVSLDETGGDLPLGEIFHMHHKEDSPVKLNTEHLSEHCFITGSTGSGKSTTIYKILSELMKKRVAGSKKEDNETVKFLVIESAKGEYKKVFTGDKKHPVRVYGTNPMFSAVLRLNPFRFPTKQVHIYEHMDRLTELFNVCWPMYAAMPAVLKAAIENAYINAGWDLLKSRNPYGDVFPSFSDVAVEVEKYINRSEYSEENKSNYKGALLTRLESLTNGINSLIFTADDIADKELFDENIIIDLSRVGSTETKSLIMGILVLKLQQYRMATATHSDSALRHVTVLEEAHNLLKRTSTEQSSESSNLLGKSVEMLANAIAEMRTFGEGFIIADQSPGLLDMSVIRNTNTKIIMRLPDFSDRELVGKAAGLNDEQIIELAKLPKGVAAVYQSDWLAPVLCKVQRPALEEHDFIEPTDYPETAENSLLFDLLDNRLQENTDDAEQTSRFRKVVQHASIATPMKIKLLQYLDSEKESEKISKLASLVYDYFENAKGALESASRFKSADEFRVAVMAELNPSVLDFTQEQINLVITLIIQEYMNRFLIERPVWREFTGAFNGGDIK